LGTGDMEVVRMVTPLLGHMGGIDEIGVFLIPALLAIYALRWADRHARKRAAAEATEAAESVEDGAATGGAPPG